MGGLVRADGYIPSRGILFLRTDVENAFVVHHRGSVRKSRCRSTARKLSRSDRVALLLVPGPGIFRLGVPLSETDQSPFEALYDTQFD